MVMVTSSALDRWQCPTLELALLVAVMRRLRGETPKLYLLGFHGTVHPEAMLELTGADAVVAGSRRPRWAIWLTAARGTRRPG